MAERRRRRRLLIALLGVVGLVLSGRAWWRDRAYQSAMAEIESEIMAGRYAIACRNLQQLLSWKTDSTGGIIYLLGSCELARGRVPAASEAWERVVPGSAFSERAIRGRMRLLHQSGRLAEAERLILDAAEDRRNDRTALLVLLVPLFTEVGRIDEAERLIEARWEHLNASGEGALEDAIKLLRLHIELTLKPTPTDTLRAFLDQAARSAPEDDRVWLGRANLAIRTGDYDEAGRWLDACERRRPDDLPIWHTRLKWGIATNRDDIVRQALTHLPDAESTPAQVHRLEAWLAASRGACRRRTPGIGTPAGGRSERSLGAGPARPVGGAGRPGSPSRRDRPQKGRDRSASSALRETARSQTAHPRRGGNGPPGRATRPHFRGPGLPYTRRLGSPRARRL